MRWFPIFVTTVLAMLCIQGSASAGGPVSLLDGEEKDFGWRFGDGPEFPGAVGSLSADPSMKYNDRPSLKLESNFSAGGAYVQAGRNIPSVEVHELSFWMKDPDSEGLTFRLIDDAGQVHQFKLRKPKSADWQQVVFPLERFFAGRGTENAVPGVTQYQHWSGPNDGKWRGPAKAIYVLSSKKEAEVRTMWLGDIAATPPPESPKTIVRLDEFPDGRIDWEFLPGHDAPGAKGSLAVTEEMPAPGQSGLTLTADFSEGGQQVGMLRELKGNVTAVVLRYKTDDVQLVTIRMADATGQVHQRRRMKLTADGNWHELVIKPQQIAGGDRAGGARDGVWHAPAAWVSISIPYYSKPETTTYALHLADIRAEFVQGEENFEMTQSIVNEPIPTLLPLAENPRSRPAYGFELTYRWENVKPMSRDYTVFVHFVDKDGKTVLRDDHQPPTRTSRWNGDVKYTRKIFLPLWMPDRNRTLPPLPDGEYAIYAGLHDERGRKPVQSGPGVQVDGEQRHKIGVLTLDSNLPAPQLGPKSLDLTGYKMTFNDEFDEPLSVSAWGPCGPGGTRWIAHTPYRGDFGDARFADPAPEFPFTVNDGVLRIEVSKRDGRWEGGLLASVDPEGNGFSQTYGYFEMRAKLPEGPGTWPAFWIHALQRVTNYADKTLTDLEIDVLEQYGHWPNKLSTAVHQWNRSGGPSKNEGKNFLVSGMTEDFHDYGVLVTEEYITFYFDGVELRREKTPPSGHGPMYVMVNLTLGPGWPLDKTPSPSYLYVDHVRVYAKE